jgi:hypothetical protein
MLHCDVNWVNGAWQRKRWCGVVHVGTVLVLC